MLNDLVIARAHFGNRVDLRAAGRFSCWLSALRRSWRR